jgi:FixJ family two-component response regulator
MLLLVDDDPKFLEEAIMVLPRSERIYIASDADSATRVLRRLGPDLGIALVDLNLPGTSGFDLIRQMQRLDSTLPLIAISGVSSAEVLASAKTFGAIDTLSKPITAHWNLLIERVRRGAHPLTAARIPTEATTPQEFRQFEHRPWTGHFRCPCGVRLTFAQDSIIYLQLSDIRRDGQSKYGNCPNCGVAHIVRWT